MPTANGPPIDSAQTTPMKGEAMGLFIWRVQAHRCRNGSRSSSGGRASSPTAAGPVTTSGSSLGPLWRNPVPLERDVGASDEPLLAPKTRKGVVVVRRDLLVAGATIEALRGHLLGARVETRARVAQRLGSLLERAQQCGRRAARSRLGPHVHTLDFRHAIAETPQSTTRDGLRTFVADVVGAGGSAQLGWKKRRVVETTGVVVGGDEFRAHGRQELQCRWLLRIAEHEAQLADGPGSALAHCTRSGCNVLAMRRMPSRHDTLVCPASSCIRVVSICTLSIVCSVGSNRASVPARPARYVHHSSMLTGSLPPQLTVTAGTEAAASSRGTMARMSSACSG